MMYTCSEEYKFRGGEYYATPKAAEMSQYKGGVRSMKGYDNPEHFIEELYRRRFQPGDFDICGNEEIFFRFDDGRCWLLEHSWYATHEEDGWTPHYEHEIIEISKDDPRIPAWMNINPSRDWLV